jgi:GH24 family phage-related lysozyme (muramidase)
MPDWPGDGAVFALAVPFIKERESLKLSPHVDSLGVGMVGWGTIRYPDGQTVTMADPAITQGYAEQCLTARLCKKMRRWRIASSTPRVLIGPSP